METNELNLEVTLGIQCNDLENLVHIEYDLEKISIYIWWLLGGRQDVENTNTIEFVDLENR